MSRCLVAFFVAASVFAAAASASSVRVSFLAQARTAPAGSAWAYYVRAQQNGKPLQAKMLVDVETPKGVVVDRVGRFAFSGSWLAAYQWNPKDHGVFVFKVSFSQHGKNVASIAYRVRIT